MQIQAGVNHGGIVENTDMSEVGNAQVDAFSGATKMGANGGVHVLLPVKKHNFEVGADYMYSSQTFTYNSLVDGYIGTRKLGTSQINIPLTFNLSCFTRKHPEGLFQLRFGYLAQFNMFSEQSTGTVPEYSTKAFSSGLTFGISTTVYQWQNGNRLGLFLDGYRGSQIYEDHYNQESFDMPGSSFVKAGVSLQLRSGK